MIFLALPIAVACLAGIVWAWRVTLADLRDAEMAGWRRAVSLASVLAATLEMPLPFVLVALSGNGHSPWVVRIEVLAAALAIVALATSLMRRGATRWLLALSAIFFFLFTSFVYLVTGLTF